MKIKKFRLKHLVSSFLSIMESSKVIELPLSFCCFAILLGFCQNLSYYFKLRFHVFVDTKLIFLKNVIFYSNFTNVLYYLQSHLCGQIVFYIAQGLVYYFIIYLIFIGIIKKYQLRFLANSKIILFLNFFFQYYVSLFYWALFIPILEIFSNLLDCNWYSFLNDYQEGCPRSSYIYVLSILAIIFTIISGFFVLWLYRTYMFIDKGLLKKKFTMILAILYISKFLLVIIYPVINQNMSVVIFLLIHAIGIYSIFDYIRNFPITHSTLSRFYISVLTSYEMVCIVLTIFEYTDWIEEPSLFYVLAILIVFSIKMGLKIYELIYHNLLKSNMEDPQFIGYCLEELYRLYHSRHSCNKDLFFLGGILKLHITKCTFAKCAVKEKELNTFDNINLEQQEKMMNIFISQNFTKNIRSVGKKNSSNARNFELIILKFSSFLNKNNASPMKAFYEIQKVFSLNQAKTFYFQSISMNILRQIRSLIVLFENKSHKSSDVYENDKELEVQTFFEMFNEKLYLKKVFSALLEKRINFWDKYKDGFHSYEEVFKFLNAFLNEVADVKMMIDNKLAKNKNSQKIIFDLKFKTILECVIFNNVNNAVKNEDELDKVKKKELTLEKNILNCTSFFNGNYTTIQASFLNSRGKILETSKRESLAKFFGFTMEEIKSLNNIQVLMPAFVAEIHDRFISFYLKKDRTSTTKESKYIQTFALDKKGFIFPIKIYVGFNFDYKYDVVFHAAFLDLSKRDDSLLLFDQQGQILGLTKEFYKLFAGNSNNIKLEIFLLLNIFNFIPNLNNIITKHNMFEDKTNNQLINQVTQIYFPPNFDEIMTIFAMKLKEENEIKTNNQSRSYSKSVVSLKSNKTTNKSIKSVQSSNSNNKKSATLKSKSAKFFSKFLQTWNKTADEKIEIERKFQDREISNFELLEILIDKNNCKRHKINFSINIIRHYYNAKDCLTIGQLNLNKISKDLREFNLNRNKFDTFYDPKSKTVLPNNSEILDKLVELEMEPIQREEDEVKSSFIVMPDINFTNFKDSILNQSQDNNNRLMTTENDVMEEDKKAEKRISYLDDPSKDNNNTKITKDIDTYPKIQEKRLAQQKTPPPDSFINTSDPSELLKNNNKFFANNTSNQKVIDVFDRSSQKSSISNLKKTFTVFAIINLIQRSIPTSILSYTFSQIIELLIMIAYCSSIYVLSVQYIDNYYNPLNEAVLNFAKMYNTYSCTNLVTVEYEYALYNYTNYQNGFTYESEFKNIISESFSTLKDLMNLERSKPTQFAYQSFFKNEQINASDMSIAEMKQFNFVDFLDSIIEQLFQLQITNYPEMSLEKLEYFSINYVNFLEIYHTISQSIDSEFFQTNQTISSGLEAIMILFVVLIFVLKCFEYCQLDIYYTKMIRILNIFLRVNQKEAFGELFLTKDIYQVLKDPMDDFLNYNYIDKVLMKRDNKMFDLENDVNSINAKNKKKANEKKNNLRKKFSFQDLKPLSKLPLLNFICFFGILALLYIGLNYYYFVIINNQITNLINITLFFEKIYTLPTTVLMINRVILREKVITNKLYNFPNALLRENQLNLLLQSYNDDLKSTTEFISLYSLNAIDNIGKPDFQYIIYGDACQSLVMNSLITSEQTIQCQQVLNTAFQKGLLNIITEIERGINDDEILRVIYTDLVEIQKEIDGILKRLSMNVGVDRVTADYFLNKLLMIFYNDLENYYKNAMLTEIGNLKIVILVTTIALGLIFILEIYFSKKYYEKIHRNITMSLNLIPYEKLLNDEQTLFLIKKYWRE